MTDVRTSYDRVADEYVARIYDELQRKPFDREMLDRFAASVKPQGLICDLGCGPGHVARYLYDSGARVCGVDLSPEMLRHARRLNPGIEFNQGDMMALDVADSEWAGVTAFYSIIHIAPANLARVLDEIRRVLRPGGPLLLAFHLGDDREVHLEELWGNPVSLDFYFYRSDEMGQNLKSAGFVVEETIERDPYPPELEHQSRRAYILARKGKRGPC
jgi:SAM-dependent methyltransferase